METNDPEQERARLADLYSHETDAELEATALQACELTEIARTAVRSELAKRGMKVAVAEYPAGDEVELRPRATIRRFRDLPEALLAKGSLDSAGVDCTLVDDNIVRMDWLWSNSMGGIKLQVDVEDAAAAEEILNQPIPEHLDVSGVGDYEQPRCPKCGSLDINFRELEPAAYVSVWLVPVPLHRRAWHCHACDVEWEDDEVPGPAESAGEEPTQNEAGK